MRCELNRVGAPDGRAVKCPVSPRYGSKFVIFAISCAMYHKVQPIAA